MNGMQPQLLIIIKKWPLNISLKSVLLEANNKVKLTNKQVQILCARVHYYYYDYKEFSKKRSLKSNKFSPIKIIVERYKSESYRVQL